MATAFLRFHLAEDDMWVHARTDLPVNVAEQFLRDPAQYLKSALQLQAAKANGQTVRPVTFNPALPRQIQVSYDMPQPSEESGESTSEPLWVFQGVYGTNLVLIRAPQKVIQSRDRFQDSTAMIEVKNPAIDIRLIHPELIGFAHFDPYGEDEEFFQNFATIVTDPHELTRFLERKRDTHVINVTDLQGASVSGAVARTGVPSKVEFALSDAVQIHIQQLTDFTPCAKKDATGNCVKIQGDYKLQTDDNGERKALFTITHIMQVPYCSPIGPNDAAVGDTTSRYSNPSELSVS